MPAAQLIQTQSPGPGQSVSVWKESDEAGHGLVYRKIWQSQTGPLAKAWLSWAHHEHLLLTLLAHHDAKHVVQVAGLHVHLERVEVVTADAGPDFQRDWLDHAAAQGVPLLAYPQEALKLARACLQALQSVHALGVMHGDFKSDNLCIDRFDADPQALLSMDLGSLRLIDFAYAVYREQPLKFVLPTDPERLTYLPEFFRTAIKTAQATGEPSHIQCVACAQVDLYSLWHMLSSTVPVSPEDGHWMLWHQWMKACKQSALTLLPASRAFDEPTVKLLALTEKLLHQLSEPQTQWGQAKTTVRASAAQAQATPLMHGMQTPMLTPLVVPRMPMVQAVSEVPQPLPPSETQVPMVLEAAGAARSDSVGRNFWQQQRWWLLLVLLALVFTWIDRRFVQTRLTLSDEGFALGLLAMALAVPAAVGAIGQAIFRSARAQAWVRYPGLILCGIALYFLAMLFPAGVPLLHLALAAVVLTLLAAALLF